MVRVHGDEDAEAGDGEGDGDEGEGETVLEFVAEEGHDHGEGEGGGPGRDGMQLGADWGVAVRLDDPGGEEGVAVGGDDEAEVHEAAEENLGVFEHVDDVADADGAFGGGAALVFEEAALDVGSFLGGEPGRYLESASSPSRSPKRIGEYLAISTIRQRLIGKIYHFAFSGKSGMRKKKRMATTAVRTPSRMKIQRHPA